MVLYNELFDSTCYLQYKQGSTMLTSSFLSPRLFTYNKYICFVIQFLIALDALIIVPFSSSMAIQANASASQSGYLTSAYALAAGITCLVIKGSQDIAREKNRLVFFLFGITVMTILTTIVEGFNLLVLTRALTGLFGGALAVVNFNYLLLISGRDNKKKNTAILLSTFPLALALGVPTLILISSGSGWQLGFQVVGGAFSIVTLIFTVLLMASFKQLRLLNHALTKVKQTPTADTLSNGKAMFLSAVVMFTAILSTFVVSTQYPVMLTINLNISEQLLSLCYTLSGLGSFIAIQYYARTKNKDFSLKKLIVLLSLLMVTTVGVGFKTVDIYSAATAFVIFIIVSSTRTIILITELVNALTPQDRVRMISLQNSLQHFAVGLGGALGSLLVTQDLDSNLDFTTMIHVAIVLIISTPGLFWIKTSMKRL